MKSKWVGWVQEEERPEVYCPLTADMQLVLGMSYITNGNPPGEIVGSYSISSGVARITLLPSAPCGD